MPHFKTSDDVSIHYETHGFDNDGPPLVFLNGMTQTTRHWATHTRKLRSSRPIVTYDARGQGDSDPPPTVPTLKSHARDLLELLDHLDIPRADLVGFSHGARVALGFATQYPERVQRLVLCAATARPTALAETIVRSWKEVLDLGGMAALAWASLPSIIGNDFLEKNSFLLENIVRASVDRNSEEGTKKLLDGLINFPPLNDLAGQVTAPTLVICGAQDLLVDVAGAQELADLCEGSLEVIENCGHTVPIERADEFRAIITAFLS